ncbi:AMP-binding protein [Colwellia sp. E150_009]|jgi:fatty-acyl-CoA synthase
MKKLVNSYLCGDAKEQLIYETIGSYFDSIVERFPENDALIIPYQNVHWTYKKFQQEVNRLATGLLNLGITRGDRVGIWGPNSVEWCLTQFATAKIGAIMVCINPAYRIYELDYALKKVNCKALITAEGFKSSRYLDMLQEISPELSSQSPECLQLSSFPQLKNIIRMGEKQTQGMLNFDDICNRGSQKDYDELAQLKDMLVPDDAINIQFTSGTTGSPKGATLSHCNILNNACLTANAMMFDETDKLCIPIPLYHCFGMVLGTLVCVSTGATAIFPSAAFDPNETLKTVEKYQCTALHGVPTMFITELDLPEFADYNLSSLRTGIMAGSSCPEEVMKRVMNDMHMEHILIGYGQTELSPLNHITHPNDSVTQRIETVGRAVPRIEVKISDSNGKVVPIGEKGEICTRGYSVMLGYWDDVEKTKETIDEAGWLHSGDIGIMDDEGYVRVVGRIKDMVIRGGENIYPREVEEFLYTHPKIQDVQVFGIPDKTMGEALCAWIKIQGDERMEAIEIKSYCDGKIAHFKVPQYIEFIEDYPMTVTGKVQKFKMREEMIALREKYVVSEKG